MLSKQGNVLLITHIIIDTLAWLHLHTVVQAQYKNLADVEDRAMKGEDVECISTITWTKS